MRAGDRLRDFDEKSARLQMLVASSVPIVETGANGTRRACTSL